jgi:hypothetical protein
MAALDALNRKRELIARPGTLGGLIQRHRASPDFTDRAVNTRRNRQWVFDYLKPLAGMRLAYIDSAFLYEVRDRAEAKHKRSFANLLIDVLRLLFSWAKKRDLMDKNPALTVDRSDAQRTQRSSTARGEKKNSKLCSPVLHGKFASPSPLPPIRAFERAMSLG